MQLGETTPGAFLARQMHAAERVTLHTTRQTRRFDKKARSYIDVPETVTGVVVDDFGGETTFVRVKFDGEWELGSHKGCDLLVEREDLHASASRV